MTTKMTDLYRVEFGFSQILATFPTMPEAEAYVATLPERVQLHASIFSLGSKLRTYPRADREVTAK